MKQLIKKVLWNLTGRMDHLKVSIPTEKNWYGNSYGGFYVAESLLSSKSLVYSFGIGEDISFDRGLIEKHGCKVIGFDPTPKSINWIKTQELPANFELFDYGIGKESKREKFYLPKNPAHVSGSAIAQTNVSDHNFISVQLKSLKDIMNDLGHDKVDVLKMDVEGTEYEVLPSIFDSGLHIDQILVEFHERFFPNGKEKTKEILAMMHLHGFEVFGISSSYEEVSFVRIEALN